MNDSFRFNHWKVCSDKLPEGVKDCRINVLHDKLIITGGYYHERCSNKVWEGTISFDPELRTNWTTLPSMLTGRENHLAVVIDNKLFCIGGTIKASATPRKLTKESIKSVEYFTFATNKWRKGPDLPFTLSTSHDAQATFDGVSQQCIITGGIRDGEISSKVSVFHPQKGMHDIQEVLDIGIGHHVAVLL